MITKKYSNGKVTIDAAAFPHMAQEAIDAAVFNCAPVAAAVAKLREYEEMSIPPIDTDVLLVAIGVYGRDTQTDMMIEEMSELTKALLKQRRAQKNAIKCSEENRRAVVEEMADVYITLLQMVKIYNENAMFEDYVNKKIHRLALNVYGGRREVEA